MDNITIDDLQIKGLKIFQNDNYFKFGIDSVLLSHFAKLKSNTKIIDLGSGNGILPLLLYAKNEKVKIYGIEIQKELYELSLKSIEINKLKNDIKIVNGDLKECDSFFEKHSFDYVVTNPPYMKNKGIYNKNKYITIARHEVYCTIEDIAKQSYLLLKQHGTLYMVNRTERLTDVLYYLREYKIEPKEIRFVSTNISTKPHLFLLKARKFAKPDLKTHKNLYIYDENNNYTKEIDEIYGKR